jgi:hypothetical protein
VLKHWWNNQNRCPITINSSLLHLVSSLHHVQYDVSFKLQSEVIFNMNAVEKIGKIQGFLRFYLFVYLLNHSLGLKN